MPFILLSITSKMQRYTILFIAVNALHISGGVFAPHQEFISCTHSTANSPTLAVAASKLDIYQMLYVQFELLMMGEKTARNM
jgi:hypothetical protein